MKRSLWAIMFALVVSALLLAACGGGGDSSSSSSTEPAAEETTTSEETTAEEPEGEETSAGNGKTITDPELAKNPITKPLPEKASDGQKVIFMQCELPACERFLGGMEESTKALGWNLETLVFRSADPGKGLETALSKNPDYIAMSGIPQEAIAPQMAKAEKQGVPIVSCSTVEQGEPGGYTAQCESTDVGPTEQLANWMVEDGGGKASIVGLTLPLYPILGTQTKWLETDFLKECPECSYENLDLTPEDLGEGKVGSLVVAYLQQHPDTEYVYSTFADPTTGLRQVLDSAGLNNVKIVTASGNATTMQEIPDKIAAATETPNQFMSWEMVDALARTSVGEDVQSDKEYQELISEIPVYVIDSAEAVERLKQFEYNWPGPGDGSYVQEFEELWQLK